MGDLINLLRGGLTLSSEHLNALKSSPDGLRRVLKLAVLVGLLAALPVLFAGLANVVRPPDPEQEAAAVLAEFERAFGDLPQGQQFFGPFLDDFGDSLRMGYRIEALDRPLPQRLVQLVRGVGAWLGSAAGLMGGWFAYALAAFIAARTLGGRGALPGMLTLTGLSLAPYALGVLAAVPVCGGLISFGLWVWSSAIFVKATSVEHEFGLERALAAWALPGILLAILFVLLTFLAILIIAAAAV